MNGTLYNSEVWGSYNKNDIEALEVLDRKILRLILLAHSKSQNEMLYLESGALSISHIISLRRLSYFHTLLLRPENEITKKIYRAQAKNPCPGDWVLLLQEDMRKYDMLISEEDICGMSKDIFKAYVQKKVRNLAFFELSQAKSGHQKVQNIRHVGLKYPQQYLKSDMFSNKIRGLLYNLRCKSVPGIRGSFHRLYNEDISCPLQCSVHIEDTQEHLLCCPKLVAHLSNSEQELLNKVKYIDLFGSLTEQKDVAEMFAILLKIRKRLLGDVLESACEGNNTRPVG